MALKITSAAEGEKALKKMEKEAQLAKSKGMKSRYSILAAEISELKRKISQMKMDTQGNRNFYHNLHK